MNDTMLTAVRIDIEQGATYLKETGDSDVAWQIGVSGCVLSLLGNAAAYSIL